MHNQLKEDEIKNKDKWEFERFLPTLQHLHITLVISALHHLRRDRKREEAASSYDTAWQALSSTQNLTGTLSLSILLVHYKSLPKHSKTS